MPKSVKCCFSKCRFSVELEELENTIDTEIKAKRNNIISAKLHGKLPFRLCKLRLEPRQQMPGSSLSTSSWGKLPLSTPPLEGAVPSTPPGRNAFPRLKEAP